MIGGIFIIRENYVEVSTPVIMNRKLWETSGHWEHYKNNMYSTVIDEKGEKQRPIMIHRVCFWSLDSRNEKTGYMIREAQLVDRVPYMLIVGQKEVEDGTVSICSRDTAKTETMTLDNFINKITNVIQNRI